MFRYGAFRMTPFPLSATIRDMRYPLFLAALVLLQDAALATPTDDLIEQFKDEVQALPKDRNTSRGRIDMIVPLLQKREWDESKLEHLLTYLDQERLSGASEKLRAIAKSLGAELLKEQTARETDAMAQYKKVIGDALQGVMKAKTGKELDQVFAAAVKLSNDPQKWYRTPALSQKKQQLQECMSLTRSVQDLLTWLEGAGSRKNRSFVSLNTSADFSEWIPRSELVARIKELERLAEDSSADGTLNGEQWTKKVNALVGGIRTLDDLPGTLKAIDALPLSSSYGAPGLGVEELRAYATTYEQLKRGQASTITLPDRGLRPNQNAAVLQGVRDQLIAFALPRLLVLPEGTTLKPGETALTFLQHTLAQAKEKRDWLLLGRIVDVSQRFGLQVGTVTSDTAALSLFLAGTNQDRAQQYAQAVTSYLAALRTGSQIVPPEHIGELLAALKKKQPDEYESASRAFEEAYLRAQTGGPLLPFRPTGEAPPAPKVTVPAVP